MKILTEMFYHFRKIELENTKEQCILDIRNYSFSQRTINEWKKLSTGCVNASSVNILKNKIDKYFRRASYTQMKNWTFDKPMASLSTCHLGVCLRWQSC